MITSLQRIGTEKDNNGQFLINGIVQVKYNDDYTMNIQFNDEDISEKEAHDLAEELLHEVINSFKDQ